MMTIGDYFRDLETTLRREIENLTSDAALEYDRDSWISALVDKYALEKIELATDRSDHMLRRGGTPPLVRYHMPVVPTETLKLIFERRLDASVVWSGPYSLDAISYDAAQGTMSIVTAADRGAVIGAKAHLTERVAAWNKDIAQQNLMLRHDISRRIDRRVREADEENQLYSALETTTGVRLIRKMDAHLVVPIEVRPRKVIAPLLGRARQPRPTLETETVEGIVELLDNQCRQFERTPSVFASLSEEDLRDVMLSTLNAVFAGMAVGEAFQGLGKADVHLRISEGELFLAEVKLWEGPSSIREATEQLLERLTWHDSHGVVLLLSKNTDFGYVISSLRDTIPSLPGAQGSVAEFALHRFACSFALPSKPSTSVNVQYLLYNLYTTRLSGRSASGRKKART